MSEQLFPKLSFLFICMVLVNTEMIIEQPPPNPDGTVPMQKMRFIAPNLTEEDQHSEHMPKGQLLCDGCRAVVYQFRKRLKKVQSQFKPDHRLTESEIIDLFDEICKSNEIFDGYGVKNVEKKKRLTGEGLETVRVAGMMQGGGKWPGRLKQMCFIYIGEVGEELMYNTFLNEGGPALEDLVCRKKMGPICKPRKKKKDKKEKEDKDEEDKKDKEDMDEEDKKDKDEEDKKEKDEEDKRDEDVEDEKDKEEEAKTDKDEL